MFCPTDPCHENFRLPPADLVRLGRRSARRPRLRRDRQPPDVPVLRGHPLFPCGHGLSYASFAYAGLSAHRRLTLAPGERAEVSFDVPLSSPEFAGRGRGGRVLEQGLYDPLIGASSEDVRPRTAVLLDGEPPAPSPVVRRGLACADFDEQSGVASVERTRTAGDAVTPARSGTGELVYRPGGPSRPATRTCRRPGSGTRAVLRAGRQGASPVECRGVSCGGPPSPGPARSGGRSGCPRPWPCRSR
ncbi:fibronectin type III-like domain-contianing protein [Streptomyces filipinensis]|uniref:fibronectin type III-like domain-contianing protein n=1 Tax=Streptomyces filipinensis TaxID=66887 RepID=UPI0036E5837D